MTLISGARANSIRRKIVAIGPLPPPTTGFAVITERMVALLSEDNDVELVNVSPPSLTRGAKYHAVRVSRILAAAAKLVSSARKARIAYVGCDGDNGLIYTAFLVRLARALGYMIYLHHHNFSYIDRPRALMRAVLRAGGDRLVHIFLCETMAEAFGRAYPGPLRHTIVSNAAFVPPSTTLRAPREDGVLTIGLLSNLNRAKGLHTFLDLMRAAKEKGLPIRGILAGPLAEPADRPALEAALAELGDSLAWLGPVHGADKDAFFAAIDVFVFPTTYANEAQPTVIFEALAAGNLVVAYDRGCIKAQVGNNGLVISKHTAFRDSCLYFLDKTVRSNIFSAHDSFSRYDFYRHMHINNRNNISFP
ncbi:MAG: glycosyltransferase family 4 protein [Mesorhizobium sp.]